MTKATLIIQARMGSTRMPGKVLKTLFQGESMLYWLLKRVEKAKSVNKYIVATTNLEEDEVITNECKRLNVLCYQGSDWDVLSRFYSASLLQPSDYYIRVCADSPLVNAEIVDFAVNQCSSLNLDYFSNGNEPPYFIEDGFCVEVFKRECLFEAFIKAKWLSEREHVTPYIKKSNFYSKMWMKFRTSYQYKLSVDTIEDFNLVEKIFSLLDDPYLSGIDEVNALMSSMQLGDFNYIIYNEGYKKSLLDDRYLG